MPQPGKTTSHTPARARARYALGLEVIAQHAAWQVKYPIGNRLRSVHGGVHGDNPHAAPCHRARNLLLFRAKVGGAVVPLAFFEHHPAKFCGTLTPFDR